MPTVKVAKSCALSAEDAFKKVTRFLESDPELRKLDKGYQCTFDAKALSGHAAGSQFKAKMQVQSASSGSNVEIQVDLPFHLGLFKGMVEKTLRAKLDETLGFPQSD